MTASCVMRELSKRVCLAFLAYGSRMMKCRNCGKTYSKHERDEMLAYIFGGMPDEDYIVLIEGLCIDCWPEYY